MQGQNHRLRRMINYGTQGADGNSVVKKRISNYFYTAVLAATSRVRITLSILTWLSLAKRGAPTLSPAEQLVRRSDGYHLGNIAA